MKNKRSRIGLSILAGGLSFVGSASAVDLVVDGSYETSTNNISGKVGYGGNNAAGVDGGWTMFSTYVYSANYTQAGAAGSGQVYLRPYPTSYDQNSSDTVSQTNTLTRAITTAQIDSSQGQYSFAAWFSTYLGQNDYSDLTLQFLDASFNGVGAPVNIGGSTFVTGLAGGGGKRAWGRDVRSGLVPPGSRYAAITDVSHAVVNLPDGYVDLVSLDVTSGAVPVQVITASPANNAVNVSPGAVLSAVIADGTQTLNNSSLIFTYDGGTITPTIQKAGLNTTVSYDPPGLLTSLSVHTYKVAFNNGGGATANTTNTYTFTVAPWVNINLPAPIFLENFESTSEGLLPAGWTVSNATDPHTPGTDLNDVLSDSYLDWVVISSNRLGNLIVSNSDFVGVPNVAPNQVINNALVTNLISGNFIIAVSDRANNEKQIQYLFTSDYNLSGKTNVYLSFHSLYTQNQDSMGSVEYSINGGTTWLPALYLLDGPDVIRDLQGNVDGTNTFATVRGDVPDVDANTLGNGHYGQYIGVNSNLWSGLGPFISARLDDNQTESKRVEIIRLAQADNQAAVRFRFAQVGTWSWYFGFDEFGLYSITSANPPLLATAPAPATLTAAVGNAATFSIGTALGLGPITYQWRHAGTNLSGKTRQTLFIDNVQATDAGAYDVVASNLGGSVTSAPPAVLTVINPQVFVTGQWDFAKSNLVATYGLDLQYFDDTVSNFTSFASTTAFGIGDINGQPTTVLHFPTYVAAWGGYKCSHNAAPNGGGAFVNQYTLIFDIYYPSASSGTYRSLWQTDPNNVNDGDLFLNPGNGIGITSIYDGFVSEDTWHRIAVAFDLSGPGQAPVLTKFIDGVKVGNQTSGLSGVDGRFSLGPVALLFGDESGDVGEAYVSSVQFSNGRRPDAFIAALGGPSVAKIPGVILAKSQGASVIVTWTGGVPLQSAPTLNGPWTTVGAATSPYTVPAGSTVQFFRPKIP